MLLEEKYNLLLNGPGDIHEHLPVLKKYSEKCSHVTEFGVNFVVSTYAFMMGKPKKLISYDINPVESFGVDRNDLIDLGKQNGVDFSFIVADTTKIEIEETDLLFIDTEHNYLQLKTELYLHSKKVKKYIIFHDTVTYGHRDSNFYGHYINLSKIESGDEEKQGLIIAITEFLEKNKNWVILENLTNCNGLMVLKNNNE
jgi:hypothetical protein